MYLVIFTLQRLLLLPELCESKANTESTNSKLNDTSYVLPNPMAVNEDANSDSGHGSLSNGVTPRVIVNNLTASWTHVRV